MAYKRKRTYSAVRRRTKRRRTMYKAKRKARVKMGRLTTCQKRGFPVSDRQCARLRYVFDTTLDASTASAGYFNIAVNDLYNPGLSALSKQPRGFDQWMAFYRKFVVLGAKVRCTFVNMNYSDQTGGRPNDQVIYCGTKHTTDRVVNNVTDALENQDFKYRYITGAQGGKSIKTVVKNYSPRRHFGFKDIMDEGSQFGTNSLGGSPSKLAYMEIGTAGITDENPAALNVVVCVDFIAMFTERVKIATS